ncbi:MAG: S-layer homology domain-containing protein [Oscillospiraceae bacterium]|nr:S-layer homology domain-containing protein [Oscillospiraceae bacterium]
MAKHKSSSATLFILQNGSWASNAFPSNTIVDGTEYSTADESDDTALRLANALSRNMIVVSYGARSRGQMSAVVCDSTDEGAVQLGDTGVYYKCGDEYIGHSPYTISDTKAAIRYVKYNMELGTIASDPDKIFVVGHSGGGALAAIIDMTAEEFRAEMADLLEDSVQHEIDILGTDLEYDASTLTADPTGDEALARGWYELGEDGNVVVGSFDLGTYLKWMGLNVNMGDTTYKGNEMKGIIAFMGQGITGGYSRNENNLFGSESQAYSVAYSDLWERVTDPAAIGVDGYADCEEFWAAEGETVGMQMKMVNPMAYLMGSENQWYLDGLDDSGDDCDVAPNWFIRHGIDDCDTSVAVVTALTLAVEQNATGDVNAYFGWDRYHNGGAHYVPEFFAWVDEVAGTVMATTTGAFTDVAANAYYCYAVNWAVANGITTGATETTFDPDAVCTRGQVVTFLYRSAS